MDAVETKKYTITGLVDYTDEQGNIVGQLEVGSVQELPVAVGDAAVADGRAEVFEGEEVAEESAPETVDEALAGSDTTAAQVVEDGAVPGEVTVTEEVVEEDEDEDEEDDTTA